MRIFSRIALFLLIGTTACQSKPAPSASAPGKEAKQGSSAPAQVGAKSSLPVGTAAPAIKASGEKQTTPSTAKYDGLYPVRTSNADVKALVPSEGDSVLKLRGLDGTWYMIGLRERISLAQVTKMTRDERLGGVHYVLHLDEAGTKSLKKLTTAKKGKRLALVVNETVIMAPEVKAAIDSGKVAVSCAGPAAPCIKTMKALYDSKNPPSTK